MREMHSKLNVSTNFLLELSFPLPPLLCRLNSCKPPPSHLSLDRSVMFPGMGGPGGPGGMPGMPGAFDFSALQQALNDPAIKQVRFLGRELVEQFLRTNGVGLKWLRAI
jgi:hypothetical protein